MTSHKGVPLAAVRFHPAIIVIGCFTAATVGREFWVLGSTTTQGGGWPRSSYIRSGTSIPRIPKATSNCLKNAPDSARRERRTRSSSAVRIGADA